MCRVLFVDPTSLAVPSPKGLVDGAVNPQPRSLFSLLFSHSRLAEGGRCHPSTVLEPLTHTGRKGNRRHIVGFEELEEKASYKIQDGGGAVAA